MDALKFERDFNDALRVMWDFNEVKASFGTFIPDEHLACSLIITR